MSIPFPTYDGGLNSIVLMGLAACGYLLAALVAIALLVGAACLLRAAGTGISQGWRQGGRIAAQRREDVQPK